MRGGSRAVPGQRHDLRLVVPAGAAWVSALITLGTSPAVALALAALAGLAAVTLFLCRRRSPWRAVVAGALVCSSAAALSAGLRVAAVEEGPLRGLAEDGADATVEVVLTSDPKVGRPQVQGSQVQRHVLLRGRAEAVTSDGNRVSIRSPVLIIASGSDWRELLPSQRVRVHGELDLPRYDELLSAVLFVREPPEDVSEPSTVHRVAGEVRAGLRAAAAPLPPAERGLLPGLVVGDRSMMLDRVVEDFRATGLTHLTAVSGTNVSIILVAVLGLARVLGLGVRAAPLVAGAAVLGFAVVARPSPSVLRATIMGLIAVLALVSGRQRQAMSALCAAVLGLVLFVPELARSYGFALSVLATAGLLVLAPGWARHWSRRIPRGLAESFAVPAAAQVACLPVLVMLSGEVSLVAVPANLLATPAVAPATVLGVISAIAATVWLPLAQLAARLGGVAARWIVEVAHVAADAPYATVSWPAGRVGALAAVILLVGLAGLAALRAPVRRLIAVGLAAALCAVMGVRTVAPAWPPQDWRLVMCDVGQGDALALAAGPHAAVVIDAGPDPRAVDRCLRDLRVRRVPLLVLTHWHADHIAGAPGVLRGRDVGAVVARPLPSPDETALPLRSWFRSAGVRVHQPRDGQRWAVGPLRLEVLGPAGRHRDTAEGAPGASDEAAENNASIVVRAGWSGLTALLTGDIEPEAQTELLEAPVRADVIKVPHHGSAAQSRDFLAAAGARVALTSVGADNSYGHPSPVTLRQLRWVGARNYRTDRHGTVAVVRTDGELAVAVRDGSGHPPARGRSPPRPEQSSERGMLQVWQQRTTTRPRPLLSSSGRKSSSSIGRCRGSRRRRASKETATIATTGITRAAQRTTTPRSAN